MAQLHVIGPDDETMEAERAPPVVGLQAEGRSFLIAAVSLSVAVYDLGFNLAVYGEVFFDKYITLWVIATAVILGSLVLPLVYCNRAKLSESIARESGSTQ